jgi:hypothetical protein
MLVSTLLLSSFDWSELTILLKLLIQTEECTSSEIIDTYNIEKYKMLKKRFCYCINENKNTAFLQHW